MLKNVGFSYSRWPCNLKTTELTSAQKRNRIIEFQLATVSAMISDTITSNLISGIDSHVILGYGWQARTVRAVSNRIFMVQLLFFFKSLNEDDLMVRLGSFS